MISVAQQIERRIVRLSDPKVEWVQGTPRHGRQSCLIFDGRTDADAVPAISAFSLDAKDWLDHWFESATAADIGEWGHGNRAIGFNDSQARDRGHVIDMLADAWVDALEEGV